MIACELVPPLRILRLDTGRLNLLDLEAVRGLRDALREATADEQTRALVLAGRDDAFCAGLDTKILAVGGEESAALLAETGALLVEAYGGPLPLVAAGVGAAR